MKKYFLIPLVLLLTLTSICHAEALEDIWNKYSSSASEKNTQNGVSQNSTGVEFLGRTKPALADYELSFFKDEWKYRNITYELLYDKQTELASMIYNLALHANDIDKTLERERFINGVLGFHYSTSQVCAWLNSLWYNKTSDLTNEEYALVAMLLQDEIIGFGEKEFIPTGKAGHILGASRGKKKSLEEVLLHERAHVYWDEDAEFREKSIRQWNSLSKNEKVAERKRLHRYAQGNEQQLIEEWAIDKYQKFLD